MGNLAKIRSRMDALAKKELRPTEISLSRHAWAAIKAEYSAEKGYPSSMPLTGDDIFGVAVTIHAGAGSNFIAYRGGVEVVD